MNAPFNPANGIRAAEANAEAADVTTADVDALMAWHERQMAQHARAVETLKKARAASNHMANLFRIDAANLKLKQEQQQ